MNLNPQHRREIKVLILVAVVIYLLMAVYSSAQHGRNCMWGQCMAPAYPQDPKS